MSARGQRPRPLGVVEVLLLLLATMALLATVGGLLQLRFGLGGLLLTELLVVLAPTLATVALAADPAALGLVRPSLRSLLGGLLVGLGGFYLVAVVFEPLVDRWLPLPPSLREQMRELILPVTGARPWWLDLGVLAVTPALCEELLFRGVWLNALRPYGAWRAALASGLAFGAFHLSIYKFAPTALLGLLAATVALRAGSVVPAMVVHLVNNSLVVLLVRGGLDDPPPPTRGLGFLLGAISVLAIAVGIAVSSPNKRLARES